MTEFHFTLGDCADGINGDHQAEINVTGEITATIGCLAADEVQAKALREIVLCRMIGYPLEQRYVAKLEDEVRELTEKLEKAQMEIEALSTENGFVHQHAEEDKEELTERAERAEAQLAKLMEQEPALVMCGGYEWRTVADAEHFCRVNHASHPILRVFYAVPVPSPDDTALIEGVADKLGLARDFGSRRHDLQFWLDSPATEPAAPAVPSHPDDAAVDRFAAAMKAKMAASRNKGRGGWEDKNYCQTASLQQMLVGHLEKGDPVDVGNFCMMLWNRGEPVAAPAPAVPEDITEDHHRLVRELDVLINGEDGAAAQASLCDIVAQVAKEGLFSRQKAPAVPDEQNCTVVCQASRADGILCPNDSCDIEDGVRNTPDADAARDGLSVRAYHEWIRGALRLPDTAPMRFDFYAQEIEKRIAAPAVPDAGWNRFTDDDLAEIHQLAYELGGTDSGEYLLDGDQLDRVVVKCASLFYAFPLKAAPAVPDIHAIKGQLTLAETEMINAKAWSAGAQAKRHIDCAMTAIGCVRDLLQSANHSVGVTEKEKSHD